MGSAEKMQPEEDVSVSAMELGKKVQRKSGRGESIVSKISSAKELGRFAKDLE